MQPLDEKRIQDIVNKAIDDKLGGLQGGKTQYGVTTIPYHVHNGTDAPQISADNIQLGVALSVGIESTASETFVIKNVLNPSRVSIYGFAANNADGTSATKRAIVNGEINFGKCYSYSGPQGLQLSSFVIDTPSVGTPFLQACNSMYIDTTDLTKTRVSGSKEHCVRVVDPSGEVATLVMDGYQNNALQFTSVLATNWEITVFITIV